MAAYFDTSVLIALFFNEPGTAQARLEALHESSIWVSYWSLAEFSSAVAFKLRTGQVDASTAATATQFFTAFQVSRLTVVDVLREDYLQAAHLCQSTPVPGLRTPDALHLAVAQRLGLRMVAFDQALVAACRFHKAPCRSAS